MKMVKLGEIASFSQGQQVSIPDQKTERFDDCDTFLRIVNYTQNSQDFRYIPKQNKKYHVNVDDIIMVRYGAVGFVGRGLEGVLANNMFKVNYDKENVDGRFLYRVLWSDSVQKQILNASQSTSMSAINFKTVSKLKLPLPPLDQQKKIVEILDTADAYSQKTQSLLDKYDQLTQSIFLDMFGDPISNPKSWETGSIESAIKKISKITKDFDKHSIEYIDISSIDNQRNIVTGTTEYRLDERPSRAQQILKAGDILFSTVRPNLKNIAINNLDGAIGSTGFFVFRTGEKLNNRFLFEMLKCDSMTESFVKITSGANYPAIKNTDLKKFKIIIPPKSIQEEFNNKVHLIQKQKNALLQSISKSKNLYDSLLQKVFKGELTN
ncbi:restriction endonuclease subunit S [Robiginitalea marina]|uniref:Restriction endonuclease subunit S n=1 Tax=Robiginitalea marina TaxID=2954105 RepID=A0ABT1ATR8_9FLAO|nr:restriction endonuclease subunit S [Robiginitalea marina]MCO5723221.1 restriction endonuclease subunit S [Robiginitalea marina]